MMVQLLAGRLGPYRLLDARSAEQYARTSAGYDYIPLEAENQTLSPGLNCSLEPGSSIELC
jgi:hypothetical protein